MRWIRILVIALALSLVGWATPKTSVAGELDSPRVIRVSKKKKKGKRIKKKSGKKRKKKQFFKEPKWAVGVRGAMAPTGKMTIESNVAGGDADYAPRLAFGLGLISQYRVFDKPSIYILAEFNHWWHNLKKGKTKNKHSMIMAVAGVRFNVWGQAKRDRHRVFVKGLVGYTRYAAAKGSNLDRSGIYFGGGVGYEYLFKVLPLSVFVDTGVYNHSFLAAAVGEKESSLLTWEIGAGLLYHF